MQIASQTRSVSLNDLLRSTRSDSRSTISFLISSSVMSELPGADHWPSPEGPPAEVSGGGKGNAHVPIVGLRK